MRIAAAVLLLSFGARAQPYWRSADGGLLVLDVERAAILVPGPGDEVGRIAHVDGGSYVTAEERIREGQQHAAMAARNAYLEAHASDVPAVIIGGAVAAGVVVGVLLELVAQGVIKH